MAIFPRGCAKILEIPEGRGSKFLGPILENPEGKGGHTGNRFRGGGMDIFWNHTISFCVRIKYFAPSVQHKPDLD